MKGKTPKTGFAMTHVEEGTLAFQLGKPSQSNPYATYSRAWAQWNQGWTGEQLNTQERNRSWIAGQTCAPSSVTNAGAPKCSSRQAF